MKDAQIVQVDQVLKFYAPLVAGDKLYCDVYVDSVRVSHGTQIIVTKNVITNEAGDVVQRDLHDPGGPCRRGWRRGIY